MLGNIPGTDLKTNKQTKKQLNKKIEFLSSMSLQIWGSRDNRHTYKYSKQTILITK